MMNSMFENISDYYTDKIRKFGTVPNGVDWKDEYGQILRFNQLQKIITKSSDFTIGDLGCGYGKLLEYLLNKSFQRFEYIGYDLSKEMISKAKEKFGENEKYHFAYITSPEKMKKTDYIIASGIFNVKMDYCNKEWSEYIVSTLREMDRKSKCGFSFNILTKYSDKEYMKDNLFYADPCFFFDYCKQQFSKNVALLHDYGLYEFTILVKKIV